MKKYLLSLLTILFCAGVSFAGVLNVGILTQLNTTKEEFRNFMDGALSAGLWTRYDSGVVDSDNNPALFTFYDSLLAMVLGLDRGEVEEIDVPEAVGKYILSQRPEYFTAAESISRPVFFAMGFRKSDGEELMQKFSEAIKAMKDDGTLAALKEKYITNFNVPLQPVSFTNFDGAQTVWAAVTGDLPPVDYVDENDKPSGFNVALLAEIGKRLEINIEVIYVNSGSRASALASKRADVIFCFRVYSWNGTQPDLPSGVIVSDSYFDWTKYLHIRKK